MRLLAIVQAMASQSARTADDVRSYQRGLSQRIGGLGPVVQPDQPLNVFK